MIIPGANEEFRLLFDSSVELPTTDMSSPGGSEEQIT